MVAYNEGKKVKRSRKKKKSYSPFYLVPMLVSVLIIVAGFCFSISIQKKNLTYVKSEPEQLTFESFTPLKYWHNKEIKFVYLTFDDGPSANSSKVMDILDQYQVKGTFFVLGTSLENNKQSRELLKRMKDDGHYIGMHTLSHNYKHLYGDNGPENFVAELEEEQVLIEEMSEGFKSELCRAPYGTGGGTFTPEHIQALSEAGFKCWDWDVDSLDWKYSDANQIFKKVKSDTDLVSSATNLVVLFHEKKSTLEALPRVIEYYKDLGYEFLPYNPEQHFSRNFFNSEDI